MHIVVHVNKFYDWLPVPDGTDVTEADVKAGRVKPGVNGGWTMKVPREKDSHTDVLMPEHAVIQTIIQAYCENGRCGNILTRKEAVARHLGVGVMPHHAHPKWMKNIEVEDDGPDEALFRKMLAPHLEADHGTAGGKNIDADDLEALVEAYMETLDAHGHAKHLHGHFKIAGAK